MIIATGIFSNLVSLLMFVVSLCLLVTIHELGHFSMAKLFNVYCHEFSIGFGPKLFSKKRKNGETTFSIRAIPLGGYVSMYGEGTENQEVEANIPKERSLLGVKKWKRAIIMLAGIFLNFVLGFVFFAINRVAFPQPFATNQVTIVENSKIASESLAQNGENGAIITGDHIVSISKTFVINDTTLGPLITENVDSGNLWSEGFTYPSEATPKSVDDYAVFMITYCHEVGDTNYTVEVRISPVVSTKNKLKWDTIGVSSFYEYHRLSFSKAIAQSGKDWVEGCNVIGKTLGGLFVGKNWDQIGGPIAIFSASSSALNSGFGQFMYLWGLISVNLAIFNLLPFPGLDGWHFVVIVFESITRKEMPEKVKNTISFIGMILLFGLMIFVTARDIIRL